MTERIRAKLQSRSGLSDHVLPSSEVTIFGFVFGEYEPGYQRYGSKKCILAIVAGEDGRLHEAELGSLTIIGDSEVKS